MINNLMKIVQNILNPLQGSFSWINSIEILIIASTLYLFYMKFIKNTQSEKLVKGLFIIIFAWIMSEVLILINLRILGLFLKGFVTLVSLSLIVIFQPELRRFLGYLGQPGFIGRTLFSKDALEKTKNDDVDIIKEIIEAVKYLIKTKTGALIVFQKGMSSGTYSDVGTKIEIQKLVLKLASEGMSVTFISSETDEMIRTCSRLIVMRDRRVVGELGSDELTQNKIMSTIAGGDNNGK